MFNIFNGNLIENLIFKKKVKINYYNHFNKFYLKNTYHDTPKINAILTRNRLVRCVLALSG